MIGYASGTITNGLNNTPIPYESSLSTVFGGTNSYLSWFYQFPGKFIDGVNMVFGIKENGISILATIFVVCIILFVLFRFTTTNHN